MDLSDYTVSCFSDPALDLVNLVEGPFTGKAGSELEKRRSSTDEVWVAERIGMSGNGLYRKTNVSVTKHSWRDEVCFIEDESGPMV